MVYPGEGKLPVVNVNDKPVEANDEFRSWQYPYTPSVYMVYEREFMLQACHFNEQKTYNDYNTALELRATNVATKFRSAGATTMGTIQHLESAFDTLLRVLADVHGHNFRVRVTATQGFTVDQEKPTALVWDEELAAVVLAWDRTNLSIHPDLVGKRATTEVLCKVLQDKLVQKFPGPHWMVEIWETPDIRAAVR